MKYYTKTISTILILITISITCLAVIQPVEKNSTEKNNSAPYIPISGNIIDPITNIVINKTEVCATPPCGGGW